MSYVITIDYFATGEGRHIWQGLVMAPDEEAAKEKFRKNFQKDFDMDDAWAFWSQGLSIRDVTKGLDGTELLLFFPESAYDWLNEVQGCGPELFIKFSMNCS
jgi:hypothetical protein